MRRSGEERRRAFEREVLPHLDSAYRLARVLVGRAQDAEDLVQDACLRAFAGFDGYRPGSNARAWLLTIVRRTCLNDRRRLHARPLTVPFDGEDGRPREPVDPRAPDPEEQALRASDRTEVLAALSALPEVYRSVLALVDMEGLRYAETAAILDCPIGTVMSRLHRARHTLASNLRAATAVEEHTEKRRPAQRAESTLPARPLLADRVGPR
jgi:RNA polymerase sigma-70 factor (ECF subfamily)